ncbi:MAG TPA: hypothetical protein ENL13_01890 [Thermoplasmatales archaeon]|nr:hypothetical protein [Thermoplasmatales archaeon]
MSVESNVDKKQLPELSDSERKHVADYFIDLEKSFEGLSNVEGKTRLELKIYRFTSFCSAFEIKRMKALSSQFKLVASVIQHLNVDTVVGLSSLSAEMMRKIRKSVLQNNFRKAFFLIALWYRDLIETLPLQQKMVTKQEVAEELKRRGGTLTENPSDMKGIYQLFINYGNKRLCGVKEEIGEMSFVIKYFQQVFKEVSYDGGYLFTPKSYNCFSRSFGELCRSLGEVVERGGREKVFDVVFRLFSYVEELKEELYGSETSTC